MKGATQRPALAYCRVRATTLSSLVKGLAEGMQTSKARHSSGEAAVRHWSCVVIMLGLGLAPGFQIAICPDVGSCMSQLRCSALLLTALRVQHVSGASSEGSDHDC